MRCKYYSNCYIGTLDLNCFIHNEPCIHEQALDQLNDERRKQAERLLEEQTEEAYLQIQRAGI